MKVAQLVADWIATVNPRVYALCGAGAMHLNDAICHHPDLHVIAMHHEQAATFAAEADARISGKPGIVHVTAGPGGTNTITGLACAYVDSIPLIVIAGQASSTTLHPPNIRQLGLNELDLVAMVKPVTKYAVTVTRADEVLYHLNKAAHLATSGRPGPVWVEIPIDIQAADVDIGSLRLYEKPPSFDRTVHGVRTALDMLARAERPVLMIGNGIRLADACDECGRLVKALHIPVVSSWGACDIIPTDNPYYIGRAGIFGCRPSNFTVQNADLILAIGTRLSVPQTGHAPALFAPNAEKIVVDIDSAEARKVTIRPDLAIVADAGDFLRAVLTELGDYPPRFAKHYSWLQRCIAWRKQYPVMCEEYRNESDGVNAYHFIEELAKHLPDDAIVVTDVGAAFIATMQSLPLKEGQRLIHSGGVSPMGWGLPAAIGACVAGGGRKVVCLTGDGGIMLNLQELLTIAQHKLPITTFVFDNGGYMTIQAMQQNHFKRESIAGPKSGVRFPLWNNLCTGCGIEARTLMRGALGSPDHHIMEYALSRDGPVLVDIKMQSNQLLAPRVQTRMENGKFIPTPIDDMWPYLEREVLEKERVV